MPTTYGAIRLLGAAAEYQWGLLTSRQATQLGVTTGQLARMHREGAVERLRHGVYRVGGAPTDPMTDLKAAWLSLAPGVDVGARLDDPRAGVVSHRSAALLHGLGDLDVPLMEFTVAVRRQTRDSSIRLHRRMLESGQWTVVDGLPVTTVLVTITDLAREGVDGGHLGGMVRDAVTSGLVDVESLAPALAPMAHRYGLQPGRGRQLIEELIAQAGVPDSNRAVLHLFAERQARQAEWRDDSIRRLLASMQGHPMEAVSSPTAGVPARGGADLAGDLRTGRAGLDAEQTAPGDDRGAR